MADASQPLGQYFSGAKSAAKRKLAKRILDSHFAGCHHALATALHAAQNQWHGGPRGPGSGHGRGGSHRGKYAERLLHAAADALRGFIEGICRP